MTPPFHRALAATLCLLGSGAASLMAQDARGAGPDARTPAAGTFRVGVGLRWDRTPEEYTNGQVRELGAPFSFSAIGPGVVPYMTESQTAARSATGIPGLAASLGSSVVHARRASEITRVYAEYGITSRLAVGVVVPFVTAALRTDASVYPTLGAGANFGLNPALVSTSIPVATATLVTQIDAARTYVSQQAAMCTATPAAPGCAPYTASPATVQQLVQSAAAYAAAVATLYGTPAQPGLPYVPLAGSAAQAAVAARLAGLRTQFAAFGAPAVTAAVPVGAPAPVTGDQFAQILTGPAYGIASSGLAPVTRRGVGNVEVSALYAFHGSPAEDSLPRRGAWWRAAVGAGYRTGAGRPPPAAVLLPVNLGEPTSAIIGRGVAEVGYGTHVALAGDIAWTSRAALSTSVRVPRSSADAFPLPDQELLLRQSPGAELQVTIAPRWTPNHALALAATYTYRAKASDTYRVTGAVNPGPNTPSDAAILAVGSAQHEHRVGASIAYSTVAAFAAGRTRWPIEVTLTHIETTSATGIGVPKLARDEVTLRWYWAPFHRRGR